MSRPVRTPAAMAVASSIAGFSSGSTFGPLWARASMPPCNSAATSTPMSNPGTTPKRDSAEYRPPMSGRFSNTSAKPRSRARSPSSDPGSVITAKRPRPFARAQAHSRWLRVSIVEPDFDDATCRVTSGSHSRPIRAMATGSVVSRTWSRGRFGAGSNVRASTSGKRLEPPIPITSTCSTPSTRASHRLVRPGRSACTSAITGIQPRRSASSVGSARQRVWSPESRRATASRSIRSRRRWRTASSKSVTTPVYPAIDVAESAAAAMTSSTTSPWWAIPGNSTS